VEALRGRVRVVGGGGGLDAMSGDLSPLSTYVLHASDSFLDPWDRYRLGDRIRSRSGGRWKVDGCIIRY
jgi:hypothetical protein